MNISGDKRQLTNGLCNVTESFGQKHACQQTLRQFPGFISSISICYNWTPMKSMRPLHTMKTTGGLMVLRVDEVVMCLEIMDRLPVMLSCDRTFRRSNDLANGWPHFAIVASIWPSDMSCICYSCTPLHTKCPVHTMKIRALESILFGRVANY